MKHHPYTEIWPLLSGKEFDQLKTDIKANGLKVPVLVYKDQVLDGRNRQRACEETGVAVRYADAEVKNDHEALNLVVSLNQYRRHLSVAELAFAAEKLATLKHGSNQFASKNMDGPRGPSTSETNALREAAAAVGSSYGSAKRARGIRNHGTDADVEDVINGRAALKTRCEELQRKATATKRARPSRDNGNGNGDRVVALYKGPRLKPMTPQEVDPEFTGTPIEFTDKYGHVQVMTAEQYATMRFADWVSNVRALATRWRELPELKAVDHNWLRSPKRYDVAKLTEALDYLRPRIAEAEALLLRAKAAVEMDATPTPPQPIAGSLANG